MSSRRRFIQKLIAVVFSMQLFYILADLFKPTEKQKRKKAGKEEWKTAGQVDEFKKGTLRVFPSDKYFLYRAVDGGFLAMSVKCTHLGCILRLKEDQQGFVCPCHSSEFSALGEVTSAPAKRPLSVFPVRVVGGKVEVDIKNAVKREVGEKTTLIYS